MTDADVEEQVQALRERFATLSDVERPAAEGDFVVIDLKATRDGEPVEGAEVSGMSYQVGRGGMIDGLDDALAGMSAATRRPSPPSWSAATSSARTSRSAVAVSQVQEQELPELDDEFAQMASEFDTDRRAHRRRPRPPRPRQAAGAGRGRP